MNVTKLLVCALLVAGYTPASAQFKGLLNKAKKEATDAVKKGATDVAGTAATAATASGKTYYVSPNGSARADGLSKTTALKDLQKAIDIAEDGATILVAEGNYLGNMDRGSIQCGKFGNGGDVGKFLKFYGGYNADFSERDPMKYITRIQPNASCPKSLGGAIFHITAKRSYSDKRAPGEVVVDGFTIDGGEYNAYFTADPSNPVTGTPNKEVLSGRLIEPGTNTSAPTIGVSASDWQALHLDVQGKVKIMNCVFVNCRDYGLSGGMGAGHIEIANNVFIACRYAACQIRGTLASGKEDQITLDFHHNTVLFSWPRTKEFEDMGQGFRFMNGIRTINVYNNIFGYHARCGVERCYYENSTALEKQKQSNLYNNYFIGNKFDLEICNNSQPINVPASRIEEAEQIGPKYEGNKEMPNNKAFISAIDAAYLKGYNGLNITQSTQYDANSTVNQVNRTFGGNQQGTSTTRVTMFANKYPWQKAKDLFGAVPDYGAQKIK